MDRFQCSTYSVLLVGVIVLTTACGGSGGSSSDSQSLLTVSHPLETTDERPSSVAVLDLLRSPEPSKVARRIKQLSCEHIDSSTVAEVRRVWRAQESSSDEPTMKDPLVRTLLAKCIVEWPGSETEVDADRQSAAQVLRQEVSNSDPQIAINALLGISHVASSDDVQTILDLGLRRKLLVSAAVTSLNRVCLPEASNAIQALRSAYAGTSSEKSINVLLDAKIWGTQAKFCGVPVGSNNNEESTKSARSPAEAESTATAVLHALNSTDPQAAMQRLLDLHCSRGDLDTIRVVRSAWTQRNADTASKTTRNSLVQTIMARCLLEAERSSNNLENDSAGAEVFLRSALEGNDPMSVIVAMNGLVATSKYDDLLAVARASKRFAGLRNVAVRDLSLACGPGATAALAEMREGATPAELAAIDSIYEQLASDRSRLCHEE